MRSARILCLSAVLLFAAAGAAGQVPPARDSPTEACYLLARDSFTATPRGLDKLDREEILKRLERQAAYDALQPGVQAMLACLMRRTAE